jgi:hypothetical protein
VDSTQSLPPCSNAKNAGIGGKDSDSFIDTGRFSAIMQTIGKESMKYWDAYLKEWRLKGCIKSSSILPMDEEVLQRMPFEFDTRVLKLKLKDWIYLIDSESDREKKPPKWISRIANLAFGKANHEIHYISSDWGNTSPPAWYESYVFKNRKWGIHILQSGLAAYSIKLWHLMAKNEYGFFGSNPETPPKSIQNDIVLLALESTLAHERFHFISNIIVDSYGFLEGHTRGQYHHFLQNRDDDAFLIEERRPEYGAAPLSEALATAYERECLLALFRKDRGLQSEIALSNEEFKQRVWSQFDSAPEGYREHSLFPSKDIFLKALTLFHNLVIEYASDLEQTRKDTQFVPLYKRVKRLADSNITLGVSSSPLRTAATMKRIYRQLRISPVSTYLHLYESEK